MKLDEVVAGLCLCNDVALNFVRCVDSRFVHEGASGVDRGSEQLAGLNFLAPFQYRRRAAQVHDRRDAVREIQWGITKIISRRHDWGSGHMNMCVRQTGNEVLSGAIYDDRIGRHRNHFAGTDRHNPTGTDDDGLMRFNALAIQRNDVDVRERDGCRRLFLR